MKRRSIFQAIAGLFAAPAVVKAAPAVIAPKKLGGYTAVNSGTIKELAAMMAERGAENPLFKGGPPSWDKMRCPIATTDGKITDYYYEPSEDGKSITLLEKV